MTIKKTDLEKIAKQLRAAYRQINAAIETIELELQPAEVPESVKADVERKLEKRICLAWDHVIPEGEPIYRGLCETDYNTTMARVRRGEDSEADLMRRGELGPKAKPGRKSAKDIAASQKAAVAEMQRQRGKKAAESKGKYIKENGDEAT